MQCGEITGEGSFHVLQTDLAIIVKSSGVEGGLQAHPKNFWFVKNPGQIHKYLGKLPQNLDKTGAQHVFDFKKCPPTFREKDKSHNNVSGKSEEIRSKILRTPKNLLAPTLKVKSNVLINCSPTDVLERSPNM